mmetsp:Transcript_38443/g.106850  ORF Transcript_38443/g.106850 Transcript_38443/m.106850 type:complete len:213 (+) Transcript_38443:183-821(+)
MPPGASQTTSAIETGASASQPGLRPGAARPHPQPNDGDATYNKCFGNVQEVSPVSFCRKYRLPSWSVCAVHPGGSTCAFRIRRANATLFACLRSMRSTSFAERSNICLSWCMRNSASPRKKLTCRATRITSRLVGDDVSAMELVHCEHCCKSRLAMPSAQPRDTRYSTSKDCARSALCKSARDFSRRSTCKLPMRFKCSWSVSAERTSRRSS